MVEIVYKKPDEWSKSYTRNRMNGGGRRASQPERRAGVESNRDTTDRVPGANSTERAVASDLILP
eukprot:116766-Rhodomonas_salina.1